MNYVIWNVLHFKRTELQNQIELNTNETRVQKELIQILLEEESDSEAELERYGVINYSADTPERSSNSTDEMNDS